MPKVKRFGRVIAVRVSDEKLALLKAVLGPRETLAHLGRKGLDKMLEERSARADPPVRS